MRARVFWPTGIARQPEKIAAGLGVTAKKGDVFDKAGLAALIRGHDAVISAVHFTDSDPKLLIEAVKEAGVKRYFVVGGAGSLEVAPGVKLFDTPQFSAAHTRSAAQGEGPRMDAPVAIGAVRRRRAHRQVPAGNGSAPDRRQGQQHLVRGLRDRRCRRTREAGACAAAVHGRVLSNVSGRSRRAVREAPFPRQRGPYRRPVIRRAMRGRTRVSFFN